VTNGAPDEFEWIASLRPLTKGDPAALALLDDAAVLPSRPGFDLVISKDALVEGVHVLPGEAPDIIARRLLRTSLSDLAAKAAEPYGYFLMIAWPADRDRAYRDRFAAGLAHDGEAFGVILLGGDTVSTVGPLVVSATVLGWTPSGRTVLRSGARAGDRLLVCGPIGDGWLGLEAALGRLDDPLGALVDHYQLPLPLFRLREALMRYAHAAADVSDGLLADAGHIAEASGLGLTVQLDRLPLSASGRQWCAGQPDRIAALAALASAGDDYAIVCAVDAAEEDAFLAAVAALGIPAAAAGRFDTSPGLRIAVGDQAVGAHRLGWRH